MGTEHRNIGRMKHFLHPLLLPLLLLLPSTAYGHKCPQDPSYSCGDDQTCCLLPQAQGVGCCPYREATCCEDKTHCCPHGLTCDTKAGRCIGSQYQLLLTSILYSESVHSNAVEKNRMLYTLLQHGVETTVDRSLKNNRIISWIKQGADRGEGPAIAEDDPEEEPEDILRGGEGDSEDIEDTVSDCTGDRC